MLKRSSSQSAAYSTPASKKARYARKIPRSVSFKRNYVTRCVNFDTDLSVDGAFAFGFSPTYLWRNGVGSTSIDGAGDITSLYDECRIIKVKMIMLPGATGLDYALNSVTSGQRNVPWVYTAPDHTDSATPSLTSIMQMDNLQVTSFDKPIVRVFKPVLSTTSTSGILMPKGSWVASGSDVPYFGMKVYIDLATTVYPYVPYRISFIITYEVRNCK